MNTAADNVRQRRSASSSRAPAASSVDETAPPVDSGKSSNLPKPPPSPAGVLGQQASARGTSQGKSQPPSTLGSICELASDGRVGLRGGCRLPRCCFVWEQRRCSKMEPSVDGGSDFPWLVPRALGPLSKYSWRAWRRFRAIRRLPTVHWRQVSSSARRRLLGWSWRNDAV